MKLIRHWNRFWFEPRETLTIGIIRALMGFLLICFLALLAPYVDTWFTDNGITTAAVSDKWNGPGHFSLLLIWPGATAVHVMFGLFFIFSVMLMLGLCTRLSAIACYILILSFHHRNLQILNSGDTLMRIMVLYLCMAPAGASFSLDARWRRRWAGGMASADTLTGSPHSSLPAFRRLFNELVFGPAERLAAPWAQRLIQCQVSLVYMQTVGAKWPGPSWRNGSALWYVDHLAEMQRFPLPGFMHSPVAMNLETWFTIAAELSMALLVWFPTTRLLALLMGIMLHLGIEYEMNVPLFSTTMMVAYLAFLNLTDLRQRFVTSVWGRRLGSRFPELLNVEPRPPGTGANGSGIAAPGTNGRNERSHANSADRVRPNRRRS